MFILTLVTGKLSKVSPYHLDRATGNHGLTGICSDQFIKTDDVRLVSARCKRTIIQEFISELSTYDDFANVVSDIDFPLFDGKEVYGATRYNSVIQNCLNQYIKNLDK